jgi:hypothetical protein
MVFALAGDSTMTSRPPRERDPLPLAVLPPEICLDRVVLGLDDFDSSFASVKRSDPLASVRGMKFLYFRSLRYAQQGSHRQIRSRPAPASAL